MAPVATASSGVSPTRKSHQKWPKARTARPTALTAPPLPPSAAGAGQLRAHEGREAEEDDDEEPDQHGDGQVVARPMHPRALADPEHAEAGQHDADQRLDGVLGNLAQLARHHESDYGHEDGRRRRSQGGQAEAVLGGAEADHDQDDLGALEEDALEGHGEADAVAPLRPPLPATAPPTAPPGRARPPSRRRSCPRRAGPCGRSRGGWPCAARTGRAPAAAPPRRPGARRSGCSG